MITSIAVAFVGALLSSSPVSATPGLRNQLLQPQEQQTPSRELMPGMPEYGELHCNAHASPKIDTDDCLSGATPLSELLGGSTSVTTPVVIPCGTCYTVDYTDGETITLGAGLNVLGRLHFPPTANVVLETTFVLVQGLWSMTVPDTSVTIRLFGTDDVTVYPHDQCNCDDSTGVCETDCGSTANLQSKPFAVVGGQLDIRASDPNCPSWTTLRASDRSTQTLTVDPAFASCLTIGDEITVACDESQNRGSQEYTVSSISGAEVVVAEEITKEYATESGPGEPMFATEVALLTRRVIFEGVEDIENTGAHSIVFHTPYIVQTIQGVSFRGFGQGGKLGRYPIHFHKSGDTFSLVSKNVIRDSHQRCVFIHDTNHVTIEDNVAFDTRGHCYATETGSEHDNFFLHNLAMNTKDLHVAGNGGSDDPSVSGSDASSFWIRNMENTFIGNRVAGCSQVGFWFEMAVMRSNQLHEDSFRDNVAHSCETGMKTYHHGWIPENGGHFKNMMLYKNRRGFKMHKTGNLKLTNLISADNYWNDHGFKNEGVDIIDSLFIGLSDDARARLDKDCPWGKDGIRASFNHNLDDADRIDHMQLYLINVEFRNFECGTRSITWIVHDNFKNKGMGDPYWGTNVTFTGFGADDLSNRPALDCEEDYSENWFMEDAEASFGAPGEEPGFYVKDNDQMQAFLPENMCEPHPTNSCTARCAGACLRLVRLTPTGAGPFESVELENLDTGARFTYSLETVGETSGKAVMVLPKGTYKGKFLDDDGDEVLPASVEVDTFRAPVCTDYVESTDFSFEYESCDGWYPDGIDKVVLSEDFEDSPGKGYEGHVEHYYPGASGVGKASALTYSNDDYNQQPAIRLPLSKTKDCIDGGTQLAVYFKAKLLNMTDNDSSVDCTPGDNCPRARFRIRDEGGNCNEWQRAPRNLVSWNKDEFNEVTSLYTVDPDCVGAEGWQWFYLDITMGEDYPPNTVKMVVDDVRVVVDEGQYTYPPTPSPSMSPTALPSKSPTGSPTASLSTSPTAAPTKRTTESPTASPSASPTAPTASPSSSPTMAPTTRCKKEAGVDRLLLNEGFESYKGRTYGNADSWFVSPGYSGEQAVAMTHSDKPGRREPAIRLKLDHEDECMTAGTVLNISFQAKLEYMSDGSPVYCGDDCPTGRFRMKQNKPSSGTYCNGWYSIPRSDTTEWIPGEYNLVSTTWTVPSKCEGDDWRYVYFDILQGEDYDEDEVKLTVDDVVISVAEE